MSLSPIRFVRETLHQIDRIRQPHRPGRSGTRAIAASAILLLAAAAAGASGFAALSWNNAAGGSASTSTNWTPNQVPTSADDLTFNIVGTYDVTLNASTPASRSQIFRRGDVSLTSSSPHAVSNGITVGSVSGDLATTTLSSGTITSSSAVLVGNGTGSAGTLNVSGASSDLVLATTSGDLTVANNGSGELNVTGGGLVQVADRFVSGSNSVATAVISISGRQFISPFTRSTLDVAGTSLASTVGSSGDVTMSVTNGGRADFAGSLNMAQGSASSSSLTIGGAGIQASNVAVGGDLRVAGNTSAGTAGGVGVLTVGAFGALDVGGALEVGNDPDGGTGSLVLDQGATVTTGSLNVGATGELDIDGGTLDVDGGTFNYTNPTVPLILGGPDSPFITLENGVAGTITSVVSGRALTVGGGAGVGVADFHVRSGSSLAVPSGDIVIGENPDDLRAIIVNGMGSSLTMSPASKLVVGQSGSGELQIEEFATASLGTLEIGANAGAGSAGLVAFELGGTVNVEGVYVGGTSAAEGGGGDFRVSAGTVCNVASPGGIVKVWPTGILYVLAEGTLNADSVRVEGDFQTTGESTINATNFALIGGSGGGSGAINGSVHIASPTSFLSAAGELILGDASSPFGFRNSGVLDCNDATVTLLDSDQAVLNTARIDGGTLIAPNGCFISSTDSLKGFGTIDADISNSGEIIATGATGLTFKGIVSGGGVDFRGTVVNFVDGGGFIGEGNIDASITADSSAAFTLTGNLGLGGFPFLDQLSIDGVIDVGAHFLVLNDNDAADLGGTTTLDSGVVFANGVLLRSGGVIEGSGVVQGYFIGEAGSRVTATGELDIGTLGQAEGFVTDGVLEVGPHDVTVYTESRAYLGRSTTLAGGTLSHTGDSAFFLGDGDTLSGSGTLGAGVQLDGTSLIRAEGALAIVALPASVALAGDGGTLDVGSHAVTIVDVGGSALPVLTSIAGGTLASIDGATISAGDTLRGHGTITTHVINGGVIEVGGPIGTLVLSDGLTNLGTIAVQIGGSGSDPGAESGSPNDVVVAKSSAAVCDLIDVTGTASLDAAGVTTLRIGQLPGVVVEEGDRFTILIADTIVGTFEQVIFDDPYLENVFDVQYTTTRVNLVATATTGVELPPAGDVSDGSPSGDGVTGGVLPEAFGLRLASRNPFTADAGVAFEFDVPRGGAPVSVSVFDASGRRVADLVSGARAAGTHAERWTSAELRALPSGVYFLRMDAGAFGATKRLVMVR